MLFRSIAPFILIPSISVSLNAEPTATAGDVIKEATSAFQQGRFDKGLEIVKPLVEKGDGEALYLMGFAHETGKGVTASAEKALDFYKKSAEKNNKDALYRMAFILLASEKKKIVNKHVSPLKEPPRKIPPSRPAF